MKTIALKVDGMSCEGCVRSVEKAVAGIDPNAKPAVDLAAGSVTLTSDRDIAEFVTAIEDTGYDVTSRA
ncbi:heavy-metal-associated domain-containing protein [Rhizobiales bacterium]|uniref:heavy-metal-associated domain-containing protein n=1 Tax=Hongsoonwoonella zoysiae TaxID=2821844 RepID=UPI0015607BF9|nr:heavy-metal-associated domain-containing protein [Hongsoonwoonella zoysiae]NRG19845.1 heavy-metal-associated domain-containing protein [Hongsoonwoonella zoysiae]